MLHKVELSIARERTPGQTNSLHVHLRCGLSHNLEDEDVVQIVKKKVDTAADGRGRFKTKSDAPLRISDREKKAALKT